MKTPFLSFPVSYAMNSTPLSLFSLLVTVSLTLQIEASKSISNHQITVMGVVYCDICSNHSFARHSYLLPGVEVGIDCMFEATSTRTTAEISFSTNRTTNKYGIYKLEVPPVDGVQCSRDKAVGNSCTASLISRLTSSCDVPSFGLHRIRFL